MFSIQSYNANESKVLLLQRGVLGQAFIFFFIIQSLTAFSQGFVDQARTTQANIEMTINNLAIVGNGFRGVWSAANGGWGSCEYPAQSGIEHMFNGGLWIGGQVNGQKLVSTGAISSPNEIGRAHV